MIVLLSSCAKEELVAPTSTRTEVAKRSGHSGPDVDERTATHSDRSGDGGRILRNGDLGEDGDGISDDGDDEGDSERDQRKARQN